MHTGLDDASPEPRIDAYKHNTLVETRFGPALYKGVDRTIGRRGNDDASSVRHSVLLIDEGANGAVVKLHPAMLWLPDDRDERYNAEGHRIDGARGDAHFVAAQHHFIRTPVARSRFTREDMLSRLIYDASADVVESDLPVHFHQTFRHPLRPLIEMAERGELQGFCQLHDGGTVMGPPTHVPSSTNVIPLMWVYTCKGDDLGNFRRVKARLTMMGNREKNNELSKLEATAPVARPVSYRLLLAIHISVPGVRFMTMDVSQAYLSTAMRRQVYVQHPPGYIMSWQDGRLHFRRLRKGEAAPTTALPLFRALYGGRECGRLFYEKFVGFHKSFGFKCTLHDRCLLTLVHSTGDFIKIVFHVDDSLVAYKGDNLWAQYLDAFGSVFQYTLKPFTTFLGIHAAVDYDLQIVRLSLDLQITKLLRQFGMDDCNPVSTPMPPSGTLPSHDNIPKDEAEIATLRRTFDMQSFCGSLTFIHGAGRPDVSLPLKILSASQTRFGPAHIALAKHVLRWLRGTSKRALVYRGGFPRTLQIFTDASHAGHPDHRRSITGVVIKMAGNTVLWLASFQRIVSHSSCESELMALDRGATIGQMVIRIAAVLGAPSAPSVNIFIDNQSTLDVTSGNPIQAGRNLHVHARYYYIIALVINKEYRLHHLASADMVADVLVTFKGSTTFARLCDILMGCARVHIDRDSTVYTWDTTLLQ